MSIFDYIKDQLGKISFSFFSGGTIIFYFYLLGVQTDIILLIGTAYLFAFFLFWLANYYFTKNKFKKLDFMMDKLDKKYFIADIIHANYSYQDKFYKELIRRACKDMLDEINNEQKKNLDYEEYTANWVHEVKTPLTAIQLLCDNERSEITDRIKLETKKIEMDVERMMYYSKSGETWKDYVIAKQTLNDIIESSIMKIYQIFIYNNICIENDLKDEIVYTDPKWSSFIVTQILLNCIQYKKDSQSIVHIYAYKNDSSTSLVIEDNGLGIAEAEISHIFEKGFVGTNGRRNEKSSGMGMYICKKLCDKLDIGIRAESIQGEYTKIILTYGEGSFCIHE